MVSVVIPSLNEEEGIGSTIDEIPVKELQRMGYDVEILVVDGNSIDRTREIAEKMGATVIIEARRGYGRAYKTGFEKARGDIIVTLDADATYPALNIPKFVRYLTEQKLDFITTNRLAFMENEAMAPLHKVGNAILTLASRILFLVKIADSQSGMWIFRKEILRELDLTSDGMGLSEEIKIKAFKKFRAKEVPIKYRKRLGAAKINSFDDGIKNLLFLLRLRSSLFKSPCQ
ncbi:glycosyltransferase family 2 protein [Candidatus Bathyarchaeota archaeon]|nr:glycosyltransferase family 2 protein [Candidatus Bathyarchaeota archaeon]